jgi:cadmium resistance protein CadD (predicted permease)
MEHKGQSKAEEHFFKGWNLVLTISTFQFNAFAAIVVQYWFKLYAKRPKLTSIITLIMGIFLIIPIGVGIWKDAQRQKERRIANLEYTKQITILRDTQDNLQKLVEFIEVQKKEIDNTETLIKTLEERRKNIEPMVKAEETVIQAIFDEQDRRARKDIWFDRMIGFGLGILASLIATVIWYAVGFSLKNKNKSELEPKS